jgi:hypothetical protein
VPKGQKKDGVGAVGMEEAVLFDYREVRASFG